MRKVKYPLLVLLLAVALLTEGAVLPQGVSNDATWDRIQKNGKIVVGVSMDYPPYEYVDTNFIADGFDIGLITALSQQMDLPFDVKNYAFNGLFNAMQTGQIDIAISAITVTPDRQQHVLFSDVYLTDTASALAPPGSPIVISSPSQLPAYRVGIQEGTVFDSYMTKNFVQTGLMPATQLYRFIQPEDAVANLVANKIDIVLMDTPSAQVFQQKNNLKMAGTGFDPQPYAIAMPLNSPILQANLNNALKTLNNNGTLGTLARQYLHVDPSTVLPPSCVDDMAFVSDVTYPDNNMKSPQTVTPSQVFVKTWRVKNNGTCTWIQGYQLVYAYGNTPAAQMGGKPVPVINPVAPGTTVDLSVTLTAPKAVGTYQGFWQMNNANEQAFGQTLWAGVTVVDKTQPTAAPQPRPVITTFTVTPGNIKSGQCVTASWVISGKIDKAALTRNGQTLMQNTASGSLSDCPPGTGQVRYRLSAAGPSGSDEQSIYISVSAAPVQLTATRPKPTTIPPTPTKPKPTPIPTPTPPMLNRPYNLTLIENQPIVQGSKITLTLYSEKTSDGQNKLEGNNGCLGYAGEWASSGNNMTFNKIEEKTGFSNCLTDVQQQSANYMNLLTKVKTYQVDKNKNLLFFDSKNNEILRFTLAP